MSEKVVRRIMAEGDLRACRPGKRRCSSYKGEISDAPENLVKRDFHADASNALWLIDITEFSIPAGKVCLGTIVDCFDGKAVASTMSTSPNAELVNTMLDDAAATLEEGEHPIGHNAGAAVVAGRDGSRGARDTEPRARCRGGAAARTTPRWRASSEGSGWSSSTVGTGRAGR